MTTHRFTVRIDGDVGDSADLDRLYDAGADDATFEAGGAVSVATFDRDADTFLEAVVSAINDIESTGYDVISVVDDDLVSVAEIAERLGRTRQSRQHAHHRRPGPDPLPGPGVRPRRTQQAVAMGRRRPLLRTGHARVAGTDLDGRRHQRAAAAAGRGAAHRTPRVEHNNPPAARITPSRAAR